jgi:hypothetical protein
MRNDLWTEDEFVIVLDVYLHEGRPSAKHPKVIKAADTMTALSGIHRSPESVAARLGNFAFLDPGAPVSGLPNIGANGLCPQIWDRYHAHPGVVRGIAEYLTWKAGR